MFSSHIRVYLRACILESGLLRAHVSHQMPRVLNFYLDDSGTRAPNRKPLRFNPTERNCFALGGVLIGEEDEAAARKAYDDFRACWRIDYPLHSVDIRHSSGPYSWLNRRTDEYEKFMRDLTRLLT